MRNYLSIALLGLSINSFFMSAAPSIAGGCNSHRNQKANLECLADDKECLELKSKENNIKVKI